MANSEQRSDGLSNPRKVLGAVTLAVAAALFFATTAAYTTHRPRVGFTLSALASISAAGGLMLARRESVTLRRMAVVLFVIGAIQCALVVLSWLVKS